MEFRTNQEVILNMKDCSPDRKKILIDNLISKATGSFNYLHGVIKDYNETTKMYKVQWSTYRSEGKEAVDYLMYPSELLSYVPGTGRGNFNIIYGGGKKARKLRKSRKAHKTRKTKKMRKSRRRMRR